MTRLIAVVLLMLGLSGATWAQPPFQQKTISSPQDIQIALIGTAQTAVSVQATGGATLTTAFQISDDGTNYVSQAGFPLPSGSSVTSTTGDGYWIFNVAGHRFFRLHTTAIAGTETFTAVGTPGGSSLQGSASGGSAVTAAQGAPGTTAWIVSNGRAKSVLTSASATGCTSLQTTAGYLVSIVNSGPATSVFLTLYDEAATPSCVAADLIYGDGTSITIGAGQVITFPVPLTNGLAYKLSGALTSNLVIVRN